MSDSPNELSISIQQAATEFLGGRDRLMVFVKSMVSQPGDAEDLLQETWIRLSEAIMKGQDIQNVGAWSRGTARNLVLEHWRRTGRMDYVPGERIELMLDRIRRTHDSDATTAGIWADRMDVLLGCIAALPNRTRAAVECRYRDGLDIAQVCQTLDVSHAAATKLLYRGRQSLIECVQRSIRLRPGSSSVVSPNTEGSA